MEDFEAIFHIKTEEIHSVKEDPDGVAGERAEEGSNDAGSAAGKAPFACDMCDYTTAKRCYLTRHRLHHSRRYQCPDCDYAASRRHHLARHAQLHAGVKPYECPAACGFRTTRPTGLAHHTAIAHPGMAGPRGVALACPMCDYRTVRRDRLVRHMARHTGDDPRKPAPPQSSESREGTDGEVTKLSPPPYPGEDVKPVPGSGALRWRRSRRLYECAAPGCGYSTPHRQHMARHAVKHGAVDRLYRCQHCDYAATTLEYLAKHKVKHAGVKPFACTECTYTAARRAQLSRHVATVHSEDGHRSRLTCPLCAFRAHSPAHLAGHRLSHAGQQVHSCPVCQYRTDNAGNMARHAAHVHAKARDHACPHCDYAGARREHVVNHVRSAHTGEAPYKCLDCGFAGLRASSLKRHRAKVHELRSVESATPADPLDPGDDAQVDDTPHFRQVKCEAVS
ncbi:hypothetical protein AAG570_007079 [Ranatra chinensis]|uniref:C2H2-type domain-containing protein n=1 Tax=Ranatra chinensis TaxID=642074 RepID=A0ABD0YA32_9HEMI